MVRLLTSIYQFYYDHVFNMSSTMSVHFEGSNNSSGVDLSALFVPVNASDYTGRIIDAISFRAWLSFSASIVTMVVILVCIAFFIRWIFKVCSNAILLR